MAILGIAPRSQWRDRAGLAPASLFSPGGGAVPAGATSDRPPDSPELIDPAAVLAITRVVAEGFAGAERVTLQRVSEQTGLPSRVVSHVIGRLVREGILHRIEGDDLAVSLARPPETIAASELMEVGFALADDSASRLDLPLLRRLRAAQLELASSVTLGALSGNEGA